jgi:hypothetical protein
MNEYAGPYPYPTWRNSSKSTELLPSTSKWPKRRRISTSVRPRPVSAIAFLNSARLSERELKGVGFRVEIGVGFGVEFGFGLRFRVGELGS